MDAQTYGILAALIVVLTTMTRILESIITKVMGKKNGNGDSNGNGKGSIELREILTKVQRMDDILEVKDSNGVHLCYYPRDIVKKQDEMNKVLNEMKDLLIAINAKNSI